MINILDLVSSLMLIGVIVLFVLHILLVLKLTKLVAHIAGIGCVESRRDTTAHKLFIIL